MPVMLGAEPFSADPESGSGIGVVLSHGFTGTPQSMRPWGEHLAAEGFAVRGPRLPGHGTTWRDMQATRWPDWYGELARAVDDLAARCRSVFVFGLSMGGTLTLRLAESYGDAIAGLCLVNPSVTTLRPLFYLTKKVLQPLEVFSKLFLLGKKLKRFEIDNYSTNY